MDNTSIYTNNTEITVDRVDQQSARNRQAIMQAYKEKLAERANSTTADRTGKE